MVLYNSRYMVDCALLCWMDGNNIIEKKKTFVSFKFINLDLLIFTLGWENVLLFDYTEKISEKRNFGKSTFCNIKERSLG